MPSADGSRTSLLREGEVEVVGRLPYSSNATFLARVCRGDDEVHAVYKPQRGERPLWDFPPGLHRREVAAYELSCVLGWDLVPPTVLADGPLGAGSLQWFVDADVDQHYFTLCEREELSDQFRRLCVFDLVANNTDRKAGHCLIDDEGHIWAIDNALCFHAQFKLRTVLWDFAGQPIPDPLLADVETLAANGLPDALAALLDPFERDAVITRSRAVLEAAVFPHDPTGRRYPWPMV